MKLDCLKLGSKLTLINARRENVSYKSSDKGPQGFKLTSLSTSLVAQTAKHLFTMRETRVPSLGWEDPLEKEMATHSGTLAWKIPLMEKPVGYSQW